MAYNMNMAEIIPGWTNMVHYNISDEELSDMTKTWETNMKNQPNLKTVNKNY